MKRSAILIALLVTLIWGINFVVIKWGLHDFPPLLFTALRFLLTAFPLLFFVPRPTVPLSLLLIYSLGTFVAQFALLFPAMAIGASAGLSSLLLQVQVFFTIGIAYLFIGDALHRWQLIGLAVACCGLAIIAINTGGDMPMLSFVLILLAAIGWASGNVATRRMPAVAILSLVVWGGLIATAPLAILSWLFEREYWQWQTLSEASWSGWFSLAYIVYLSTLVCYGLWGWLLQNYPVGMIAPFTLLVPISGFLSAAVLMHEPLPLWKLIAGMLILLGLAINLFGKKLFERYR